MVRLLASYVNLFFSFLFAFVCVFMDISLVAYLLFSLHDILVLFDLCCTVSSYICIIFLSIPYFPLCRCILFYFVLSAQFLVVSVRRCVCYLVH